MQKLKTKKTFIKADNPFGKREEFLEKVSEYLENGLLCKETELATTGTALSVLTKQYNSDGQIEEMITKHALIEILERAKYEYENGLLSKVFHYIEEEKSSEIRYQYDAASRLILEVEKDEEGTIVSKIEIDWEKRIKIATDFYDDQNYYHQVETHFDQDEKTILEIERNNSSSGLDELETSFQYDENKNLVNIKMYEHGKVTLEEDYFFNENGIEIKSSGIDYDVDEKTEILRIADEENRIIREEQFVNDQLHFYFEKVFENGQLAEERIWQLEGESGEEELKEYRYEMEYY